LFVKNNNFLKWCECQIVGLGEVQCRGSGQNKNTRWHESKSWL